MLTWSKQFRYSHTWFCCLLTGLEPKARVVIATIADTLQSFDHTFSCLLISAMFNTGAHVLVELLCSEYPRELIRTANQKLRFHSDCIEHSTIRRHHPVVPSVWIIYTPFYLPFFSVWKQCALPSVCGNCLFFRSECA